MALPIEDLTPKQIVAALDRYIVGQHAAKKAVAVALRNRFRRQQVAEADRGDIVPKNILMIGPTGVGKTEIARRLAQLARAPFIKVEATKFTEVGYVGRDVDSMVRDLAAAAVRLVEAELIEAARPAAEEAALDQLVQMLDRPAPTRRRRSDSDQAATANPLLRQALEVFGRDMNEADPTDAPDDDEPEAESAADRRARLRAEITQGLHDDAVVEIEQEEQSNPFVQVFTPQGMEEMGLDLPNMQNPFARNRTARRKVTVAEARRLLVEQEARRNIDPQGLHREAVTRAEQTGIIFLDEIDKIAIKSGKGSGPDVSREGVQRDLLPIIEGSAVQTKFGQVRTDHVLFIAAGAFHESKPSDLIPELQGRLPIRVELESLTEVDFARILLEPHNSLTKQYTQLLKVEGVELTFTERALERIAHLAAEVNSRTENIGARRLHTMLERLLEDEMFLAPDLPVKQVEVDADMVDARLGSLVEDTDLSRYIL